MKTVSCFNSAGEWIVGINLMHSGHNWVRLPLFTFFFWRDTSQSCHAATRHWTSPLSSLLFHIQLMLLSMFTVEGHMGSCYLPMLVFGCVRSHSARTISVFQVVFFFIFPQDNPAFLCVLVNSLPLVSLFSTYVLLPPRPWVEILNKTVP